MIKRKIKKWLYIILFLPILLFGTFLVADYLFPLPISQTKPTQTILSQNGSVLWRFADSNGIWRYPVTLDELPQSYLQALLTYEDRDFYQHYGIDFLALARASWQNLSSGKIVSGGSTLSMQVARIIDPHERTFSGKFKQVFRTLQLEWHYSKDEILTLYVNRAPFGGTLEGIGAASWSYLGKPPNELSLSESALLAVLPQAPSRLRPDRYPERAQQARDKVLERLLQYQVWSAKVVEQVKQEEVWAFPKRVPQLAPLLARRLAETYHKQNIIHSTIDESLQFTLEDLAKNWKNQLPPKTSLAILVVDHTDLTAKAYVGSIDFNDATRFGQVDMIKALRSPGSTLKPFIYGLAINDGIIHSQSLLQDIPRITTDYRPLNFDEDFNGPVTASEALQRSLNLPAVQLMEHYGPKRFSSQLSGVGLSLHSIDNIPNISYILGGVSVRMDEVLSAYSCFARSGKVAPIRYTLEEPLTEKILFDEGSAWVIRQILAGQQPPTLAQTTSTQLPLAWKTGTSYGYRDAWAIGINARYLMGVWVGRPDGTPVVGQYGSARALPILKQVDRLLLNKEHNMNRALPVIQQPESVTITDICWPSGQELVEKESNCHRIKRAWIVDQMIPPTIEQFSLLKNNYTNTIQQTIWVNNKGLRVNSDCEGAQLKKVALWPIGLENWIYPYERRDALIPAVDRSCPVKDFTPHSTLLITGITSNMHLKALPGQAQFSVSVDSQGGIGKKWWFLNGNLVAQTEQQMPISISFKQQDFGKHQLLLLDESGQIAKVVFFIE